MARLVNVPLGEPKNPGETAERVNSHIFYENNKQVLERPANLKGNTVYEYIVECLEKNKRKDVLAYRKLIDIHEEEKTLIKKVNGKDVETKKTWQYYELGDYKYERVKNCWTYSPTTVRVSSSWVWNHTAVTRSTSLHPPQTSG